MTVEQLDSNDYAVMIAALALSWLRSYPDMTAQEAVELAYTRILVDGLVPESNHAWVELAKAKALVEKLQTINPF